MMTILAGEIDEAITPGGVLRVSGAVRSASQAIFSPPSSSTSLTAGCRRRLTSRSSRARSAVPRRHYCHECRMRELAAMAGSPSPRVMPTRTQENPVQVIPKAQSSYFA